jgi:AcrR family transcriptional regulator
MSVTKKMTSPGGKREKRKDEIIASAANCFMERGYHATSIDDIARHLGSTKGRIYHYYGSKTDLFFDVHRIGMGFLFDALAPALARGGDGATVLRAMLLAHAEAMLEHHTFENVVAQGVQLHRFEATTPDQRDTLQTLIASRDIFENHFKDKIKEGIKDGSLLKVDVSVTVKVLLGGLQWSIFWYRPRASDTAETRKHLAKKMVDPLLNGLRNGQFNRG